MEYKWFWFFCFFIKEGENLNGYVVICNFVEVLIGVWELVYLLFLIVMYVRYGDYVYFIERDFLVNCERLIYFERL